MSAITSEYVECGRPHCLGGYRREPGAQFEGPLTPARVFEPGLQLVLDFRSRVSSRGRAE